VRLSDIAGAADHSGDTRSSEQSRLSTETNLLRTLHAEDLHRPRYWRVVWLTGQAWVGGEWFKANVSTRAVDLQLRRQHRINVGIELIDYPLRRVAR